MSDKIPFIPVYGTEDKIEKQSYSEGHVYFSTDTRKIYLDTNESRLSMGGNTGIYYGKVDFGTFEGPEFDFTINDIEDYKEPNLGDLIINTDGCFYKVIRKSGTDIITNRIVLSGSGTTGPDIPQGGMSIKIVNGTNRTALMNSNVTIDFVFEDYNAEEQNMGAGRYEILIDNVSKKTGIALNSYGETKPTINSIPIKEFLKEEKTYTIYVVCYGSKGGSIEVSQKSQPIYLTVTNFSVKWEHKISDIHNINAMDGFSTSWIAEVQGEDIESTVIIDNTYTIGPFSGTNLIIPKEQVINNYRLEHGVHTFEVKVSAVIGGVRIPAAESITKNLIFYDENNTSYIIVCDFFDNNIQQYDTVQFPVMIYHPNNAQASGEISFSVNGEPKGKYIGLKNFEQKIFTFTPEISGLHLIEFKSNNGGSLNFILNVSSLNIPITEVLGYEFKFKASDFSTNEEIKKWKIENNLISFSENFDWINGGLITDDSANTHGVYFNIPAGSTMTIPYELFATNLKTSGACCKIIFEASNCRDYDAQVLACYNNSINKGLRLNAQNGIIQYTGGELDVQYCEDTYIEYEFNIDDDYLTIWLDGVPSMVKELSLIDSFQLPGFNIVIGSDDCDVHLYLIKFYKRSLTNNEHLNNFIIDVPKSAEIKARYDRNDIEMTDSKGNKYISPTLLAQKNPNCNVYVYKVPYIPTSKDDVFITDENNNENYECCDYIQYKGSDQAIRSYSGVKLRAQGTSSMAYGISAYNLDAKFPEKWAMDDQAIPVNYYNTKVNVASCEGANNALNQEWYNRYQPYKTQKRLQLRNDGKVARDTMQFQNGVLFIEDHNQTKDSSTETKNNVFKEIDGYISNPYPRMYSIANMGNSKKNTDVFHGAGNIYECCVEVADNNTSGQRMVTIGGFYPEDKNKGIQEHEVPIILEDDLFDEDGFIKDNVDWGQSYDEYTQTWISNEKLWEDALINEGLFEFRYCIDEDDFKPSNDFTSFDKYQKEISKRFLRLVRWFAKWNPANTYSEDDLENNLSTLLYQSEITSKENSYKYQLILKEITIENIEEHFSDIFSEEKKLEILNQIKADIEKNNSSIDQGSDKYNELITTKYYNTLRDILTEQNKSLIEIDNSSRNEMLILIHNEIITQWKQILVNNNRIDENENIEENIKQQYALYIYETKYTLDSPVTFSSNDLKVPSIRSIYSNYNAQEILSGKSETSLAKTYKLDSKEYRAARMLSEAGKYLIMDSIVYHYLFIERHTMVDNVAKNTFWNTEDGIHWELTKNYDNDTSDGVNNSGFLAFNYGIEPMDSDASGSSIFNARPSAWLNFISLLPELRENMYRSISSAWRANSYLTSFENWQNVIPERCWIEDFYRKYFRPREIYNDNSYLPRLANGKKTHQRKQYETYQEQYMDSEYKQNTSEGNYLEVRLNQPTIPGATLYQVDATLTPYADGYMTIAIASGAGESASVNIHQRIKKGVPTEFKKTQTTSFDDGTFYIYSPGLYTEFTGIENLYPQYVKLSSGIKLRKISFNATQNEQKNTFEADITLPNNIENLQFINCKSINQSLNLSDKKRLKILNTEGSSFTSCVIAEGAPLSAITLEKPEGLLMKDLFYLKPEQFKIKNYSVLRSIDLNNIDFNINSSVSKNISKNIVENIFNGLKPEEKFTYSLNNVGWKFNSTDELNDTNIFLLDKLLGQLTINGKPKAQSLTGFANISSMAYNSSESIDLYNKYSLVSENDTSFPNFDLQFYGDNAKLYNINVKNGDGKIVWTRKVSSLNNLSNDLLNNGSLGVFDSTQAIFKSESNEYKYEFDNKWKYTTDDGEVGYIQNREPDLTSIEVNNIYSNISIEPVYIESINHYTINFYNENEIEPFYSINNAIYGQTFNEIKPLIIPAKDDSLLDLTMTYEFNGYSATKDSTNIINENAWTVLSDANLYAVFIEKDVYDIDYSSYLELGKDNSLNGLKTTEDGDQIYSGRKIVIPESITTINSNAFYKNKTLKNIFVNGTNLTTISSYAFGDSSIEYFEFVSSITNIGTKAFYNCPFKILNYNNVLVLPDSLKNIGESAFNGCFTKESQSGAEKVINVRIPGSIETIGETGIAYWRVPANIYIGTEDLPSGIDWINRRTIASNKKLQGENQYNQSYDIHEVILYSTKYSSSTDKNNNGIPLWDANRNTDMIFNVPELYVIAK